MSQVVMLWLDGFSSRYLTQETTPFLHRLCQASGMTTLEPLFAFAGIGVSAFTGTSLNTHRVWCDWVLGERRPAPATLKLALRLCDLLPDDILNQYARYGAIRLAGRHPSTPNLIPVALLDRFTTREQRRLTDPDPVPGVTTLFDQLRAHGVAFALSAFHESLYEGRLVPRVRRALKAGNRFILVRLASLDRLGHRFGPQSPQVARRLRQIDDTVERLTAAVGDDTRLVIFSEHGMAPVTGHVDLMGSLNRLPLRPGDDYLVFLNSTVACLWAKTASARQRIRELLSGIDHGVVLDSDRRTVLGIDSIGAEYGDILFALDEGYVFFPDFYRKRRPPKGMHGYAEVNYDRPVFILHLPGGLAASQAVQGRFIDVMPTLLHLLGLPVPAGCEGRSLVEG